MEPQIPVATPAVEPAAPTIITPTKAEIEIILALHKKWALGDPAGKRADCKNYYLRGAYLRGAYLGGADLRGAYLGGADLGGADLRGADLGGAYLRGADLGGAYLGESTVLPTGETWGQYLADVVPALLTAGGKSLDAVMATGCWKCHDWNNCPMAEAFGIKRAADGPILLRPRIDQFVEFFDARLIEAVQEDGKWVFRSPSKPKPGVATAAAATPAV